MPEKDRAALLAYQKKAGELQRAMMGAGAAAEDALKNLAYIKKAILDTPRPIRSWRRRPGPSKSGSRTSSRSFSATGQKASAPSRQSRR